MLLRSVAIGMTSTVDAKQDLHIVCLDYDIKDFEMVKDSIIELQSFWGLSDAFIYSTKNGFHVFFFFDHVPYARLRMIIDFAKWVDPVFKYIARYFDHKTIRVAGKYKDSDIRFYGVLYGRRATDAELEIGALKLKEHKLLSGCEVEEALWH